jgi:hypothetical protein
MEQATKSTSWFLKKRRLFIASLLSETLVLVFAQFIIIGG